MEGQDTAAGGYFILSLYLFFLSERQKGGCLQGFCWHEGFGEGEGGLAHWAGGAASCWLGVAGGARSRLSRAALALGAPAFAGRP